MKVKNVEVTDEEERRRETVAYNARTEENLEKVLENTTKAETQETEEAVDTIRTILNDNIRQRVTNHFEAPIRSLNNPEENTVQIQEQEDEGLLRNEDAVEHFNTLFNENRESETEEVQVVGEEYFVNQNLDNFPEVSNIQWWTVYEQNSYREETRGDRGGEHLNTAGGGEGELKQFHIQVDGENYDTPEQVQRLARNLRIRNQNEIENTNNIPETILQNKNIEEAVENTEKTRKEFKEEYRDAVEKELVTEDGDLTLKGWLSAADLHASDIRQLENIAQGNETLQSQREAFENITNSTRRRETLTLDTDLTRIGGMYIGPDQVEIEPEKIDEKMRELGVTRDELVNEDGEVDVEMTEREVFEEMYGEDIYEEGRGFNLEKLENRMTADNFQRLINSADHRHRNFNYSEAELEELSLTVSAENEERELQLNEMLKEKGIKLSKIADKVEKETETKGIQPEYKGESPEALSLLLSSIAKPKRFEETKYQRIKDNRGAALADLFLTDFEDELEENDYTIGDTYRSKFENYQDLSEDLKSRVEMLEEENLIETDEKIVEETKINLNPETEEDYRLIDQLARKTDLDLPTTEKTVKPVSINTEKVRRVTAEYDKVEEIDEEIEGTELEKEILDLISDRENREEVFDNYGRETEYDHDAKGLKKKLLTLTDKNNTLKDFRRSLIGRTDKICVREDIGPKYSNLRFTTPEYEDEAENIEEIPETSSEELYSKLQEWEEKGHLELKYNDDTTRFGNRNTEGEEIKTELINYEDSFEVEDLESLDEETREMLYKLEENDVAEIDEGRKDLNVEYNNDTVIKKEEKLKATHVDLEEESTEEITVEYDEVQEYEVNDQVRTIAEALNPLNFESEDYSEITVENNFNYNEA